MRKNFWILFIIIFLSFITKPNFSLAQQNKFCVVYFTYIGCQNCAYTDPLVLTEWTERYPNLVVIEYMWQGGEWQDQNSQFFGEYASAYRTQAAVPQIVIDKDIIRLGRIDIPKAETEIEKKEFNLCPLIDKSISFEELNLGQLPAKPKIWANQRILIPLGGNQWLFQWNGQSLSEDIIGDKDINNQLAKNLFFADNISKTLQGIKFEIVNPQKAEFSGIVYPDSDFVPCAEFKNAIKINVSEEQEQPIIPEQSIQKQPTEPSFAGASEGEEEIEIPIIGKIETEKFSLPILTFLIGLADGFNPCAFFILTFLLAALISLAGARKKILLVGGIFILFSALFYFLFMSALLNVFKLGQEIVILTLIAGAIAIFAGAINIKDYFAFQKGISLTLPKGHKAKFMERVKNLSSAKSTLALVFATVIIAATVNIYEVLCTFGFPMVYTRILTLRELPSLQYYLYLIFYNLIYIIPLATIVLIFTISLGRKTFSQIWVRRLKLISGFMILFLGLILIIKPKLLESISTTFGTLILAIIISGVIILIYESYHCLRQHRI